MGFIERLLGNLMGGKFGGRHGGYRGGHGGSQHGGYPEYPQGGGPGGGNLGKPCPKCGGANAGDARFCQQCGASLDFVTCSNCGAELPAGAGFCGQCGTPRREAGT